MLPEIIPRQTVISVGTSVVVVSNEIDLNATSYRKAIILKNTSTGGQKISLGIGLDAVNGSGEVLDPGDYIIESASEGYFPTFGKFRITAIASAAGGTLAVMEAFA